jgi:hypothetical protein
MTEKTLVLNVFKIVSDLNNAALMIVGFIAALLINISKRLYFFLITLKTFSIASSCAISVII